MASIGPNQMGFSDCLPISPKKGTARHLAHTTLSTYHNVALLQGRTWIKRVLAWHPRQRKFGQTFTKCERPQYKFLPVGSILESRKPRFNPGMCGNGTRFVVGHFLSLAQEILQWARLFFWRIGSTWLLFKHWGG